MSKKNNSTTANLGFEEKLWAAADKLRGHMDPSEYKHTVLGLIFLKYISDRFSTHHEKLQEEMSGKIIEQRDVFSGRMGQEY